MRDKDNLVAKAKWIAEAAKSILIDIKDQPNIDAKKFVAEQDALYQKSRKLQESTKPYDFVDALTDVYHILNKSNNC